jgi:predicted nuclease of predicted toxin-antitoxin system
MKFLLDQSADARLGVYLMHQGHDVTRVGTHQPEGMLDEDVLALAQQEQRILLTEDLDFDELVLKKHLPHSGVILFRFGPLFVSRQERIDRLEYVLQHHLLELDQLIEVTLTGTEAKYPV